MKRMILLVIVGLFFTAVQISLSAESKDRVIAPFDYGKVTGGGVMSGADKCGVNVTKTGWQYDSIITGGWSPTVDAELFHNGYIRTSGMSPQNSEIEFRFCCEEDSFVLVTLGNKNSDYGISHVYIDGAEVGTLDWYNFLSGKNIKQQLKILIPTSGEHTLRYKMATKNGSSSDYHMNLIAWWLRKGSIGSP